MKSRLKPATFATIVIAPIVGLHLVLFITRAWSPSSSLIGVGLIDAVSWTICFFIWRQTGRRLPPR
ncbi:MULTISPECIES: hypothetical protein [unclassified Microbacterium]|uniref:hypothetical protein n=1 Tax=unclassified Microbacterium TaxID=2609290 RepID=UPI0016052E1E|nr:MULTISPECIES: hypothetical protein [unclassified Microbacterium]QNA93995.1 hypothetical protein G4G29_20160 [Microbacterium sp. Se63.02b]QYM64325.1 hypothetical protein K1X59_20210 [Microbacterium sp. Se5.02b]